MISPPPPPPPPPPGTDPAPASLTPASSALSALDPPPPVPPSPWSATGDTSVQFEIPAAVESASRRRIRPAFPLVGAGLVGISLVVWLITDEDVLLLVGAAVVAAALVDVVVAYSSLAGLEMHIMADGDVVSGEESQWLVRIDGLRRPVSLAPALLPRPPGVLVTTPAGGLVAMPALSRGVVYSLAFDVTVHGPIGLFEAGQRFRVRPERPVFVGPRPSDIEVLWPVPKAVGFATSEVAPVGDDLYRSTRPYVRGDSLRRVNWKATARHGELMVREQDGTGVALAQIVVELGPAGPRAEHVAAVSSQIARSALQRGWAVHLVTADATPSPPPETPLGSPFGPPPSRVASPAGTVVTTSRRVRSVKAINDQLATAAAGAAPTAPRFEGMVCRVSRTGIVWS